MGDMKVRVFGRLPWSPAPDDEVTMEAGKKCQHHFAWTDLFCEVANGQVAGAVASTDCADK